MLSWCDCVIRIRLLGVRHVPMAGMKKKKNTGSAAMEYYVIETMKI